MPHHAEPFADRASVCQALAIHYLDEAGGPGGDFRVDPAVWAKTPGNRQHTKTWLSKKVSRTLFTQIWGFVARYIDWDTTFAAADPLPLYFVKKIFAALAVPVAELVLAEHRLNNGKPWPGVASVAIQAWETDAEKRAQVCRAYEVLGPFEHFRDVDGGIFMWVYPEDVPKDQFSPRSRAQFVVADIIVGETPPPPRPGHKLDDRPILIGLRARQASTSSQRSSPPSFLFREEGAARRQPSREGYESPVLPGGGSGSSPRNPSQESYRPPTLSPSPPPSRSQRGRGGEQGRGRGGGGRGGRGGRGGAQSPPGETVSKYFK